MLRQTHAGFWKNLAREKCKILFLNCYLGYSIGAVFLFLSYMLYEQFVRPFLFRIASNDPEIVHQKVLSMLTRCGNSNTCIRVVEKILNLDCRGLEREVFGLKFRNPIGLAAGFDKNGIAVRGLQSLGFGFIEVGTVTRYPQEGNPRPRIFRFTKEKALINRMGFNNDGADFVAKRLKNTKGLTIPIGISFGKSKITPLEEAISDYEYSLRSLYPHGDYFVVNVSSPNTPDVSKLQEKELLRELLSRLVTVSQELNTSSVASNGNQHSSSPQPTIRKPLLVKVSPDLSWEALDDVLSVCLELGIAGIIATNTTLSRDGLGDAVKQEGGLSGSPLFHRSLSVTGYIHEHTGGKLPIIGAGGVFEPEHAYAFLQAGASLVQVYTGFVFQGPLFVKHLCEGLRRFFI